MFLNCDKPSSSWALLIRLYQTVKYPLITEAPSSKDHFSGILISKLGLISIEVAIDFPVVIPITRSPVSLLRPANSDPMTRSVKSAPNWPEIIE